MRDATTEGRGCQPKWRESGATLYGPRSSATPPSPPASDRHLTCARLHQFGDTRTATAKNGGGVQSQFRQSAWLGAEVREIDGDRRQHQGELTLCGSGQIEQSLLTSHATSTGYRATKGFASTIVRSSAHCHWMNASPALLPQVRATPRWIHSAPLIATSPPVRPGPHQQSELLRGHSDAASAT